MAQKKKKQTDKRKLAIQIFALVLCGMLALLSVISSYFMMIG